ncbi:UNVERIFIED_CONTAM: hypothetical protein FKN15_019739 [Acipenser sinensis]
MGQNHPQYLLNMCRAEDEVDAAGICNLITALEETKQPTAPLLYNKMSDFTTWLQRGTVRITFGDSSPDLLKEASFKVKQEILETVHNVFEKSILKFSKNFDTHPALPVFKPCHVLDPRQVHAVSSDLADYSVLNGLTLTNDEWWIYIDIARNYSQILWIWLPFGNA